MIYKGSKWDRNVYILGEDAILRAYTNFSIQIKLGCQLKAYTKNDGNGAAIFASLKWDKNTSMLKQISYWWFTPIILHESNKDF